MKSPNHSRHDDVRADEEKHAPFHVYKEDSDAWLDPETNTLWESIHVPVWRWRRAMFNNQRCRMDWCVKPYEEANHHPCAVLNGQKDDVITILEASPGQTIDLDASGSSDPDGDPLAFRWSVYGEAGTYAGDIDIPAADAVTTSVTVPKDAAGKEIHIILEVQDKNLLAPLFDYRRLVIQVSA